MRRPVAGRTRLVQLKLALLSAVTSRRTDPRGSAGDWLKVSRTPVREALRRLLAENLLHATDRGVALAQLDQNQVIELYALREFWKARPPRSLPSTPRPWRSTC